MVRSRSKTASSAAVIYPGFAQADGSARRRFCAELADRLEGAKTCLFESLVLLGLLDLVFSFGLIRHAHDIA